MAAAAAAVEQKYISQNGENSICKCSPDEEASREIYQWKLALSLWQSNLGQPIWVCVPHPPAQPSQIIAGSFTIPNPKFQSTSNCLLFDQLNDRRAGQAAVPQFLGHFEYGIVGRKIEKRFLFESAGVCNGLITFKVLSSIPIMCECCVRLCASGLYWFPIAFRHTSNAFDVCLRFSN